jgi:hypothetical protein
MDLPDNWEKYALIGVVAVLIISVIYALNPFPPTPENDTIQQTTTTTTIIPFPKNNVNKTNSSNNTAKITLERAKEIAAQTWPGYTVGQPISGSVTVNDTTYSVWIVPLTKQNTASKTIYIDINTGNIVLDI